MRIDSHQHFWNYSSEKHGWINDEMSVLKRNFSPENLASHLHENGLSGSIAVQADQSEEETNFLLELAEQNELIKGVVGWVDLMSEGLEDRLTYYSKFPKLVGFRHVVQDEPDPQFMLREDFRKGLSLLAKHGFTYDILIFPHQLEAALKTVQDFPTLKFVLDHIAKPNIKSAEFEYWEEYIRKIAAHANVFCKVSGMITEADWDNWKYEDFRPFLDTVTASFGINRVMYGSDWPVCLLAGSYAAAKGVVDHYFQSFSPSEKEALYGGNALSFYGLVEEIQ